MAVTAYTSYIVPSSQVTTDRPAGVNLRFVCDTFAELPTGSATIDGDTAYCNDTQVRYARTSGAWVESFTNNCATWGQINGTLSNQADLWAALSGGGLSQAQVMARSLGC